MRARRKQMDSASGCVLSFSPTIRLGGRCDDRVSLLLSDQAGGLESLRGIGHSRHILAVIFPNAAGTGTGARHQLVNAATVGVHNGSRRRVRALVYVVGHTISVAIDFNQDRGGTIGTT